MLSPPTLPHLLCDSIHYSLLKIMLSASPALQAPPTTSITTQINIVVAVAVTEFKYQLCLKSVIFCCLHEISLLSSRFKLTYTGLCYDSNSGMSFEEPNDSRSS